MKIGQEEIEINKDQEQQEMKKEEIMEDRGKDKNRQIEEIGLIDRLREGEEAEVVEVDLEKQAIKKKGKEFHKNNKKNKLKKK